MTTLCRTLIAPAKYFAVTSNSSPGTSISPRRPSDVSCGQNNLCSLYFPASSPATSSSLTLLQLLLVSLLLLEHSGKFLFLGPYTWCSLSLDICLPGIYKVLVETSFLTKSLPDCSLCQYVFHTLSPFTLYGFSSLLWSLCKKNHVFIFCVFCLLC